MKEKIVLDVEIRNPQHNDCIVYDQVKGCWYKISKDELIFNERKQIKENSDNIKKMRINVENTLKEYETHFENADQQMKEEFEKFKQEINGKLARILDLIEPLVKGE
jgi:hypothetical protein